MDVIPVDHDPFAPVPGAALSGPLVALPVDHDPFADVGGFGGDAEAVGAAAASQAMQPAVQAHFRAIGDDISNWAQSQAAQAERLQGAPLAARALDPEGLQTATNIALATGPGAMLYRAGGPAPRYGSGRDPTFYSTTPEGAAPYATHGDTVASYDVPVNNLFDVKEGNNYSLYKQFLDETGHPGGFGKNGYPFWTTEPELAGWLKKNNVPFDSIKFDENTGHPSIAVYPPSVTAYHGSPHDFDAFDMSKIGTGEGAQVYGQGMYFAENEGIARSYRDRLSPPANPLSFYYYPGGTASPQNLFDPLVNRNLLPADVRNGGMELYARLSPYKPEYINDDMVKRVYGELGNTINNFETYHAQGKTLLGGKLADEQRALQDARDAKKVLDLAGYGENQPDPWNESVRIQFPSPRTGKVYQVGINADPEQFLHWDKPLSEQTPHVQQALSSVGIKPPQSFYSVDPVQGGHVVNYLDQNGAPQTSRIFQTPEQAHSAALTTMKTLNRDPTGGQIYESSKLVPGDYRDPYEAAQVLKDAGIPGIKYLDANSRNQQGWHITPPDQTVSGKWMVKSNDYNSQGLHFDNEADARAALAEKMGDQKHNYVVFDDKLIDIIKKYGLAGLIAGGAMTIGGNADAATHAIPVDHDPFAAP